MGVMIAISVLVVSDLFLNERKILAIIKFVDKHCVKFVLSSLQLKEIIKAADYANKQNLMRTI